MGFKRRVYNRARDLKAHIVLPEATDPRMQRAASEALGEGLAGEVTFIGDPDVITSVSKSENTDIAKVHIVHHVAAQNFEDFARKYFELRKHKGVTLAKAFEKMKDTLNYGAMMVRNGLVDGMVAGAVNSTAKLLRAAITIVGVKPGEKTVSSCFVMILPDKSFGYEGQMIFADCATVPFPDLKQLAEIAIASAETGRTLIGFEPRVAMLSYSTKGSATHESIEKIVKAVDIVREKRPDLVIDGELQVDAALVQSVAEQKCPGSPVEGMANVFIFPDLHAGNITYKAVQRLAHAEAYGPVLQGLARPVNDLSRGCTVDDIVNVIAVTAVQCATC